MCCASDALARGYVTNFCSTTDNDGDFHGATGGWRLPKMQAPAEVNEETPSEKAVARAAGLPAPRQH